MFTKKGIILSSVLIIGSSLFARERVVNEDVQYILDWHKLQRAKQVANQLQFSSDQVQELEAIKAEVDLIKNEAKKRSQDLAAEIEALAKTGRAQIESEGKLALKTQNDLRAAQRERRRLTAQTRLKIRLATLNIRDILNPEQIRLIRDAQSERPRRQRQVRERKGKFIQFVLSDAFMNQLKSPQ